MYRPIRILFATLATLGFAVAAQAADPLTIRIGTPDQSVGSTPSGGINIVTLLDVQRRFETEFAKEDIKIQWTYFKGAGPAVNEAFANKQLDFAYIGDLAAIIGRASGLPTRFLVPIRGTNSFLAVAPDSGIKRIEDLKGKRITVFKGTAYQLSLGRALTKAGLTERDLQVVNLDWNAALAALAAKQLDANWAGLAALTLQDKGLAKVAVTTKDLGREFTFQSGFVGTEDFLAKYPELTQRLVNVLVKTQQWLSEPANLNEFITLTSQRSGVPEVLGHAELDDEDLKFRFSPRIDAFIVENFDASIAQAKDLGLIRKSFDAKSWVEPKFSERALADLKLAGNWPAYDKQGRPQ